MFQISKNKKLTNLFFEIILKFLNLRYYYFKERSKLGIIDETKFMTDNDMVIGYRNRPDDFIGENRR